MKLDEHTEAGVAQFMKEYEVSHEEAIAVILRDWLIGHGYITVDTDDD